MSDPQARPGPFDGLPAFAPLADDLPPQMKAALLDLRKALTEPPSMGDQFPFALPPALQSLLDPTPPAAEPRSPGRPAQFKPAHAVQLVRWVEQGSSVRAAAKRAGIPQSTARLILKGQCSAANRRAITGAGYLLPATPSKTPRKNAQEPRGARETGSAGVDAPPPPQTPIGAL